MLEISPDMLTLVAAVLAYDLAREMCDTLSSAAEVVDAAGAGRRLPLESRRDRSCTRLEKDMMLVYFVCGINYLFNNNFPILNLSQDIIEPVFVRGKNGSFGLWRVDLQSDTPARVARFSGVSGKTVDFLWMLYGDINVVPQGKMHNSVIQGQLSGGGRFC